MMNESDRFQMYLDTLKSKYKHNKQYEKFVKCLQVLFHEIPNLRIPSITEPTENFENFILTWSYIDLPKISATIQITPECKIDSFFINSQINLIGGTEYEPDDEIPQEIFKFLKLISLVKE